VILTNKKWNEEAATNKKVVIQETEETLLIVTLVTAVFNKLCQLHPNCYEGWHVLHFAVYGSHTVFFTLQNSIK
jgi:hypothetical protein